MIFLERTFGSKRGSSGGSCEEDKMSARVDSVKLSLPLRWVSYQNGVESYSEGEADKDHDEQDINTNLQTTGVRGTSVSTNRRLGAQVLW